jgi:DNA gyrase subunit B
VEGRVVRIPASRLEIAGAELERLLHRAIAYEKLLQTVERRGHARDVIESLVAAGADREFFADKQKLDRIAQTLTTATRSVSVQRDEEHNRYLLHIDDRSNGYPRQHRIGVDFVTAAEYRTLLANRRDIPPLGGDIIVSTVAEAAEEATSEEGGAAHEPPPAAAKPKPPDVTLHSLEQLVEFFIGAGKKGVAINRYKGLGEMNPEQLWETTMNPQARTLLQVRAEDHTEADLMFTTLMGDQVEPRRKFIEDNALDVKNLDV